MSEEIKPEKKPEEKKTPEAVKPPVPAAPVKVEPVKPQLSRFGIHRFAITEYDTGDVPQEGLGTTLLITPVSGTAVNAIKVTAIKMPTWSGKDIDVTGMSDTFDQYIPGVPNAGEGEIDIVYLKTQAADLYALKNVAGTTILVTYPDGATREWTGWINSYGEEVPLREKISQKIKCRASSLITFA